MIRDLTPYPALWRVNNIPGKGVEYRAVTVVSTPRWGHVKCLGVCGSVDWAVPVDELVGVDGDSYAARIHPYIRVHDLQPAVRYCIGPL